MNNIQVLTEVSHRPAQNEAPHLEAAQDVSDQEKSQLGDGGYFQLSHSVFRDPKLRELPGDAFRLFLWLSSQAWRFRNSDGTLRASVGFITEALGMPHATVSRGLKILREGRLIHLVKTDFKQGNLWSITSRATWSPPIGKVPHCEATQIETPQKNLTAPSNRGGSHLNLRLKPPQIEAEIRNTIPFNKSKNSLSPLPEALEKYLSELRPAKKRESERAALEELKQDYSLQEISDCMLRVLQKGIPDGEGTRACHSPLAFLAKAMAQILPEVEQTRTKATERIRREAQVRESEKTREAEESREADEWAKREAAFHRAFSTSERRQEAISELLRGTPFSATSQAGRSAAVGKWWNSLKGYDRTEFST